MVFGVMTAVPLQTYRREVFMLLSKIKKETSGLLVQVNPNGNGTGVWALSRYDAKSLYNKKPTVTEIMSGGPAFWGFWKLTMEVFGLAHLMECIVMMERPSRTLKVKRIRNNVYYMA